MISRIRRRIRARLRSLFLTGAAKAWLLCALCATAGAAAPAAAAPPGSPAAVEQPVPPQPSTVAPGACAPSADPPDADAPGAAAPGAAAPAQGTPAAAAPDDSFLEFLGSDDVGDAAWWEFLKKAPPPGSDASAKPPQDAKK
jgi:hypothetical protein